MKILKNSAPMFCKLFNFFVEFLYRCPSPIICCTATESSFEFFPFHTLWQSFFCSRIKFKNKKQFTSIYVHDMASSMDGWPCWRISEPKKNIFIVFSNTTHNWACKRMAHCTQSQAIKAKIFSTIPSTVFSNMAELH